MERKNRGKTHNRDLLHIHMTCPFLAWHRHFNKLWRG